VLAVNKLSLLCLFVFVPLFCVLRSFIRVVFVTVRSVFCVMLPVIFINDSVVCLASGCWCIVYVFLVYLSRGLPLFRRVCCLHERLI
jgi:hypothetical protein